MKEIHMPSNDLILKQLISYAENEPRISAMVLFGSRAREEKKADRFSDYDLIFFVNDVDYFIHTDEWLSGIAEPRISFFENTAVQDYERRVFFDDAMDMDFLFYNVKDVERITADPIIRAWYAKGHRILVDKINYSRIVEASCPAPMEKKAITEEDFCNNVNNFWFHTIWATKKLRRGEVWVAKNCIDVYLKNLLREMLEYEAIARNGAEFDIWHDGRFFDEWVDPSIRSRLRDAYGKYDRESLQLALWSTMELYTTAARNTARLMNYSYPTGSEEYARRTLL
jgi:aminoglycoside 6-adenylyltransferase